MKRWKKAGIFIWSVLPFVVLANISNIETDALERAYARKECKYQADKSREKDFKAKS